MLPPSLPRDGATYELSEPLGHGGMATVCLGLLRGPRGFSRQVAIKRLHPHIAADPHFVRLFIDEARIASGLSHPNIVPTLDLTTIDGVPAIVMEFVQGVTLSRLRSCCGPLPPPVAASLVYGVLLGLHYAHEARDEAGRPLGIVHRDVSPQNVLLGRDGVPRLTDFGIATAAHRTEQTRAGEIRAKFAYAASEQLTKCKLDRRADVYGASVVLWELLTGVRMTETSTLAEALQRVRDPRPRPPSLRAPEVPRSLDAIVLRGLSVRREERFPTALAMADALEGAIALASSRVIMRFLESKRLLKAPPRAATKPPPVASGSSPKTTLRMTVAQELLRESTPPEQRPTVPPSPSRTHRDVASPPALELSDTLRDIEPRFVTACPPPLPEESVSSAARADSPDRALREVTTVRSKRRRPLPWLGGLGLAAAVILGFIFFKEVFSRVELSPASPTTPEAVQLELPRADRAEEMAPVEPLDALPEPSEPSPAPALGPVTTPRAPAPSRRDVSRRLTAPDPRPARARVGVPVLAPAPSTARSVSAAASSSCVPPFEVDSRGVQSFKRHCLTPSATTVLSTEIVDPWAK